jgi:hypothetical protein
MVCLFSADGSERYDGYPKYSRICSDTAVQDDVPPGIEACAPVRRDDDGRVVFLDDQRSGHGAGQKVVATDQARFTYAEPRADAEKSCVVSTGRDRAKSNADFSFTN